MRNRWGCIGKRFGPAERLIGTHRQIRRLFRQGAIVLTAIRRGVWFGTALAMALVLLTAGPAHASCAEPIPIDQSLAEAETVFVGTVTGLDFAGRVATFEVQEVWKGDVEAQVVVNGGPALAELRAARAQGQDVATSVDRTYEFGVQYLVVSHGSDGSALADNSCSNTQPYTDELDQYRPASAHVPEPLPPTVQVETADEGLNVWLLVGLAVAAVGVVGAITAIAVRRRRQPSEPV